jgi:hypothetical protein
LRTRVEKVEELKVEGLKMETKIKNVASMNNSNCSTSHPLTNSSTHLLKVKRQE